MNFGKAFEDVKKGKIMRLPSWKRGVVIEAHMPQVCSEMTVPYLAMCDGIQRSPWHVSTTALFSEEWEVYDWETLDCPQRDDSMTWNELCKEVLNG